MGKTGILGVSAEIDRNGALNIGAGKSGKIEIGGVGICTYIKYINVLDQPFNKACTYKQMISKPL